MFNFGCDQKRESVSISRIREKQMTGRREDSVVVFDVYYKS
jgi:hypothetical protein